MNLVVEDIRNFHTEIFLDEEKTQPLFNITGQFDKNTGRMNLFFNPSIEKEKLIKYKDLIQKNVDNFKQEISELMKNENFIYRL